MQTNSMLFVKDAFMRQRSLVAAFMSDNQLVTPPISYRLRCSSTPFVLLPFRGMPVKCWYALCVVSMISVSWAHCYL